MEVYVIIQQHLGNLSKAVAVYTGKEDALRDLALMKTILSHKRRLEDGWRKMDIEDRWILEGIDELSLHKTTMK